MKVRTTLLQKSMYLDGQEGIYFRSHRGQSNDKRESLLVRLRFWYLAPPMIAIGLLS